MLADFPVLRVDAIVKRTLASCIVLAAVALGATFYFDQYLAGAGVVLGLAGATVNHRLFQISTAHYSDTEGHLERRPYAGTVAARLGGLTLVAFVLLFLVRPMGFGMIAGLVGFQLMLMANALGTLWRYQKVQLAGLAGSAPAGRSVPETTGREGGAASGEGGGVAHG